MFIIGGSLIYFAYRSKYQEDLVFGFIEIILSLFYLILLIINLVWAFSFYGEKKKHIVFLPILIGILMILPILIIKKNIRQEFNKPTLLRGYYDGDFNGVSIDFKEDKTYIINNYVIGFNEYEYGIYTIKNDSIFLDVNETGLQKLIFKKKENEIFLIDNNKPYLEFRITEDNRKK